MNECEKWLFQYSERKNAKIRLICFHYAAGNAAWYSKWEKYCGDDIELMAVQLPQRSERIAETMPDSIEKLVAWFIEDCAGIFDKPFVIFGHSMGAMAAFETALQIKEKYGIRPELLVVSACGAPVYSELEINGNSIMDADDDEIKYILNDYGQIDSELLDSEDFCDYYFPIVRSDFHACETYSVRGKKAVDCDVLALKGISDAKVTEEDCTLWEKYTERKCRVVKYKGGHFFPDDHTEEIIRLIRSELRDKGCELN